MFNYLKSSESSYMELSTHLLQANSDKSSFFTVSLDRSDNCSAILFLKLTTEKRAFLSLWCTAFPHTNG